MATNTRSNFYVPKATLMAWVKTQLNSGISSSWTTVRYFEGQNITKLYHFLPEVQPPSCVYMYRGTKYAKKPRATPMFSVFVVDRNFRDKETMMPIILAKVDKVIELLDYGEVNSHAVCLAQEDKWVQLWSNDTEGTSCYQIDFNVEDN